MVKITQKSVEGRVYENILKNSLFQKGERICVAVSGGADSISLLSILLDLRERLGIELIACHYNHRLRGVESDNDQKFVEGFCRKQGIKCVVGGADQKNSLKSEDSARLARYSFFQKILGEGRADRIVLAHHKNDLAETTLLRLIRGTGIRGLRSIPSQREKFCRPLLPLSRSEIEEYLKNKGLAYRTDSSNSDTDFSRNYIRHNILPLLIEKNPNVVEGLNSLASSATDDYDFLERAAEENLAGLMIEKSDRNMALDYHGWSKLHPSMKKMTLRLAIDNLCNLTDITSKQLCEVVTMLNKGAGKRHKVLPSSLRIELLNGKITLTK